MKKNLALGILSLFFLTIFNLVFIPIGWGATDDPEGARLSTGAMLFESKGCSSCHAINNKGGDFGPSLDSVSNRYSPEWLYVWLKDPEAVKPGTPMPALDLTDDQRAQLVFYLLSLNKESQETPQVVSVAGGVKSSPPDLNPDSVENDYLSLGVEDSYIKEQRYTLQDLIQTFIPPLYEPALTQSAFVLPPGAARVQVSFRNAATIKADDFAGQMQFGGRFVNLEVKRRFLDFDGFLGLDHNFTLRINVPFSFSSVDAAINPAFNPMVTVFPQGEVLEIGDIGLFVKKKLLDQGNSPIALAVVGKLTLPTGSNSVKFDPLTVANVMGTNMLLPLPAVDANGAVIPGTADGTFRRFSNDGRLPAPLQPGLGTVSVGAGLFVTRVLEGTSFFGRGAIHAGGIYEFRPAQDGIDPGNTATAFFTVVKPLLKDNLSLDVSYIAKYQQEDSYAGNILVPTPMGNMIVARRPFSGGTTHFVGTSLILIPNPQFKLLASGLIRISQPHLGPSPKFVFRISIQHTFATGLFK